MVSLAAKPSTLAFASRYSTGEKTRGGPGDRGPTAHRAHAGSPSLPLELFPVVKSDGAHFGAILKVFCFIHVVSFAFSKSLIITHSLSIFFKYYEKSSTEQEFFPLLRGRKGPCLGLISHLRRSHGEGKVVGKLFNGMARLAGTRRGGGGWRRDEASPPRSHSSHKTTSQKPGAGLGKVTLNMFLAAQR